VKQPVHPPGTGRRPWSTLIRPTPIIKAIFRFFLDAHLKGRLQAVPSLIHADSIPYALSGGEKKINGLGGEPH